MMKNTVPSVLAFLLLASAVSAVSCGGNTGADERNSENGLTEEMTAQQTENSVFGELPEKDYGGEPFHVLCRNEWNYEFIAEKETGSIINDAVYARNLAVEEYYHVDLDYISLDGDWDHQSTYLNAVSECVLSGDNTYDMFAGYQAYMVTPAMEGYLCNILDIPYIEENSEWWSQQCCECLTIGRNLFMITGDIALTLWDNIYVMYFNKKIAADYDMPDLYDAVKDGGWTLDRLMELSSAVSGDINGNGTMDENDLYGFLTSPGNHMRAYVVSCNTPIACVNADSMIELCYNTERSQSMLDKLITLHEKESSYTQNPVFNSPEDKNLPVIFTEDRAFFMTGYLGNSEVLRTMDSDFGILPCPKLDEQQADYRSTCHNSVSMICFPVTLRNPEMSGILTEALCRASNSIVIPKYYDTALKTRNTRDNESAEMIDIIRSSLVFDLGWVHSVPLNSIGTMLEVMVASNNRNFASTYKTYEAKALAGLEIVNAAYNKIKDGK